ncbi:DNA/RNA non-specific endonuclease [Phycicoccus sp. MAQZ13P-2]|uniref:DNA/RNA non-specific endonuclease n=1 Tax=Phycicoccus mangrovi TaxID=2840470 RepID=UPI001C001470|nr:DNA/RNA non-specific endonuclease [Phycicoccus mangrovi]MBT9257474.1 DNA/RNA non-specific endonuclease [Phycicoccus mangrovi]MBT9275652.1 DNA/RNA non-specific endonuclease [Phycicoccus mangrovi]
MFLDYTHFTVGFNTFRRLCWFSAWNFDGARLHPGEGALSRDGLDFFPDARLDPRGQALDDVYRNNRFDRGHIARRADLLWGPLSEAQRANRESFCYTKITPQMDNFNQSGRAGSLEPGSDGAPPQSWGLLENAVLDLEDLQDRRLSVFGGPVLRPDDPIRYGLQIPLPFWKVVVYVVNGELRQRAFLLTQRLETERPLRSLDYLEEFRTYQVSRSDLEDLTGMGFSRAPSEVPSTAAPEAPQPPLFIREARDVRW